ncbi:hypothetical protein DXG03_006893 [Asterophora parasitica]|uniref:Uncharacterized protein n=1 Tax=Asterophora parasitica TaxID=117018 RepID=A0A9P7G0Q3_9AGAR|nr:hypothetical protein DXG03_006893 [Asterophora parasitica]
MPSSVSKSSFSALLSILLLLPYTANGARLNDWSKPCFQGECFYDLPASNTKASGSLKIWGSPDAISDITTAAGWTIIGCSPTALAQDIRLVCNSDDTEGAGCDHLYQNIGAVGKLVRLPESCGKSAFARVSRAWVPEDQSIPQDIARRLVKRQDAVPEVKALALDTDFDAIDPAKTGEVNIAIQGSTVPGKQGDSTIIPPTRRRRGATKDRRGLFSVFGNTLKNFSGFNKSDTKSLPAIDFNDNFPLFSQSVSCDGFNATLKADVAANAHAVVTLGVAATGTIVPPELTELGVFTGLDAKLDATLNLVGNAKGRADSGQLTLFQTGIPGLDFPGILTVGPTFKVLAQASADVDLGVNLKVDLSYTVSDAKIFFPPGSNQTSGGTFTPGEARQYISSGYHIAKPLTFPVLNEALKLSVTPNVASSAVVSAHLIPRVDLGLNALGGVAQATVSLDLDASASVNLKLNGAANANLEVESTTGDVSSSAGASVDGCVKTTTAINVNGNADSSFFSIFDRAVKVPIFGKDFEAFEKCFGAKTKRDTVPKKPRRGSGANRHPKLIYRRQSDTVCPSVPGVGSLFSLL